MQNVFKNSNIFRRVICFVISISIVFSIFMILNIQFVSAKSDSVVALKVTNVSNPASPYLIQIMWLEPNTQYSFSYMYSNKPADYDVAIKGKNEKKFKQTARVFDDEKKKITITFTTSDQKDSEATMGTGANAGKIQAFVGIRLYAPDIEAIGTYFADLLLYKTSDLDKTNLFKDPEFTDMGSILDNKVWSGVWNASVLLSFNKQKLVDDSIFKIIPDPKSFTALKVTNVTNPSNPFFIQNMWLKPNTEYSFSYLYSNKPADYDVAIKGKNEKKFKQTARVFDDEKKMVTITFTTSDEKDSEATMGTGANAGKIQAFVGIRLYSPDTEAVGTYFADFELYQTSDSSKTNLFKDPEFSSRGSVSENRVWNGLWENISVCFSFSRQNLESDNIFKIIKDPTGFGVLKVTNVTNPSHPFFIQNMWLKPNTEYSFSYLYSNKPADYDVAVKGRNEKKFQQTPRVFDDEKKKVTITFTTSDEKDSEATMGTGANAGKIQAFVGIRLYAPDTEAVGTYFADFELYQTSDLSKTNLFKDPEFSNMGSLSENRVWNGLWENISVCSSFSRKSLDSNSIFDRKFGVMKCVSGSKTFVGQWIELENGKTYISSFYHTPMLNSTHFSLEKDESWSQHFNISNMRNDDKYLKSTVEFTPQKDNVTEAYSESVNYKGKGLLVYVGFCLTTTDQGYIYDWVLYEKNDPEKKNLLEDPTFSKFKNKQDGGKWYGLNGIKNTERFDVTSLEDIGGMDTFLAPDVSGGGSEYVIRSSGQKNPYFMQQVSLDPKKTYAFSFYHSNKVSQDVYTGEAHIFLDNVDGERLNNTFIDKVINDKEWNKTTTIFSLPKIGDEGVVEDPSKPGNILVQIGIRVWEEVLYYYNFQLYDVEDTQKNNILLDCDFNYIGYKWFQHFWWEINGFSRVKLSSLDGGIDYFKKVRGPDIAVPLGPKMMSYGADNKDGLMYIQLPYSVKKGQTTGKYYIVSLCIRPTEGREPIGFVSSNYNGGTTAVSPISVDGYKYTFYLQERYDFKLGIKYSRRSSGYLSCLEMYQSYTNQNIIGKVNLATSFGKDGTFSDWDIQSGLRWLELADGCLGTYPGELPENYKGRTNGTLVKMPKGYFVLENPGVWWKESDIVKSGVNGYGTVKGVVKNSNGAARRNTKILLQNMNQSGSDFVAYTNSTGLFIFNNVPIAGYELYIVESNGNKIHYEENVWIEGKGDTVELKLTYNPESSLETGSVIKTGVIKGYIVDEKGKPIANLSLGLEPDNISIITDKSGYFEIRDINVGIHSLYVLSENSKKVKIADIETQEGICYELTSNDGTPLVYSYKSGKVNKVKAKVQNNNSSNSLLIVGVSVGIVVILVAATIIIVMIIRSKKKKVR